MRPKPNRVARVALAFTIAALAVTGGALAAAESSSEVLLLRVHVVDRDREIPALARLGLDIAGIDRKASTVDVVGDRETLALLEEAGFVVEIAGDLTADEGTILALSDYLDPLEIELIVDQWVASHPGLVRKVQYATSEEGRPLWAVKISDNVQVEENESVVFFVAQHHAREVMTPEIATDIGGWLLANYGTDPDATRWVDEREIWILTSHNPDGANHVFTAANMWRKNRRDNGNGTFGVDLNRNYPFQWGACGGSSGTSGDDTYRGPSPASEPETFQGILELAREHRPVINLSYHTYSELVIMPYGCSGSHTPENAVFRDLSSTMATRLVSDNGQHWYEPGTGWEILYAVDGEMTDWFYAELGSYGMTVEANASVQGFQPDYATWRNSTVDRNRPGWMYLLDRPDGSSIRGNVTDACSGAPLAADLSIDEIVFSNGETPRTAEPVHGRYHWLTVPGLWTLRVGSPGYLEQSWPTTVGRSAVDRDVRLVAAGSRALAVRGVSIDDAGGDVDGTLDPGEDADLFVTLIATGEAVTGVGATLVSDDPLVSVLDATDSYGNLATGETAQGDGFRVAVSAAAPDGHEAALRVVLSAAEGLCVTEETVRLRITRGTGSCPEMLVTLDQDPGWTIENSGTGGWEFGPPAGNGGSTGPASAPTGANVYGTNLDGSYGNGGDYSLITGPFDLRGLRATELHYQRWLSNEAGFDIAAVDVSIDGGANWQEAWSGFEYGEGWQEHRVDLAPWADLEEDVRLRFRLRSDSSATGPGFYVDDVALCGEAVPFAGGKLKYSSHAVSDDDPDDGNGNGVVDAGETATLAVEVRSNRDLPSTGVEAFLTTGTPGVEIRNGYASFADVAAGSVATSDAPHFSFHVDAGACAARITFDLIVRWSGGQATSSFVVPVGASVVATVLDDAFEADSGWVTGGTASAGAWVRENPYGVNDPGGQPVQPEDDHTADPGNACWITANPRPKGNFNAGDGDVDGGTVWIESPPFDGALADRLDLTFWRWFVRRNAGTFDSSEFRLLVSNDGGSGWQTIETTDGDAPAWTPRLVDLTTTVSPTATMKLRLEVEEDVGFAGDTLLEALIDDVRVERERLECAPFAPPALLAPNGIADSLRVEPNGPDVRLDWVAPVVDASHDAASGYSVYRSSAADGGFSVAARPTAPFAVLFEDGIDPTTAYFLVVAENAGGTSGDEPAP